MAKIGILGGTFNPIHLGHIKLAQTAYDELKLDTIWFMPSKKPPHKDNNNIVSEKHRVNMIKLAIDKYNYFEVSTIELERVGTTYTSYTLEYLHNTLSDNQYYFIVGADSIYNIETWNRPEVLFKLANFVVAIRDNVNIDDLKEQCDYLVKKYNANINIVHMNKIDISSSYIRQQYNDNMYNWEYINYIDSCVNDYIINNKLYM